MRHAGACEGLPEWIADFALIADHQRAHLGVFGIDEVAIEELADMSSYRFNLARGETGTMPDDLKSWRTEQILRRRHRCVDAVAGHQADVVELAGVSVVAWEMDPRVQPDFIAKTEDAATEHCDSDIAGRAQHRLALLGGALDF